MSLLIALVGCNRVSTLNADEYISWYKSANEDIKQTKVIGDYTFKVEYRPLDLVVLTELLKSEDITQIQFDSLKPAFAGMHYFLFRIGTSDPSNDVMSFNIGNKEEYYKRVRYFSETAQNDFSLIDGTDTLSCALFHLERTYNTSPYNNMLLGFEKNPSAAQINTLKLLFNDNMLGHGLMIFSFSNTSLNTIPQLTL